MIKISKYVSRRNTPWSDCNDITSFEAFISDTYESKYNERHRSISDSNEASFLNDYKPSLCPHCGSKAFVKNGKYKNGVQKYRCSICDKSFNILTNTIFDNHKISISEWIEFLLYLFGYESIQEISKSNKNSSTTSKYWLKKLFLVLENYQDDIVLEGKVYLDEMYYRIKQSDIKFKGIYNEMTGLSENQICIGVAKNDNKIFVKIEGFRKTNKEKTLKTFEKHIAPKSHLIHDEERAHIALVKKLELTEEAYNAKIIKLREDKNNPLDPINKTIMFLRKFLNSHPGFNREELQGYINLFVFMTNEHGEPLEKVKKILDISIITPISLKYRQYYKKKGDYE